MQILEVKCVSEEKQVEKPKSTEMEYSSNRMNLIIRECPPEIAHAFFNFARTKWHGKQWVALKDLIQQAEREERDAEIAERIKQLENLVVQHDMILSKVSVQIVPDAQEPAQAEEVPDKKPRTCGGGKNG